MAPNADILERSDPLTVPFWGSLFMHAAVIGFIVVGAIVERHTHLNLGSQTGGGLGSVTVNPVASIPLPNRGGPENPVANDTQSQVPTPPVPKEKPKPTAKVKAPPDKAIPIKVDKVPKTAPEPTLQPNKFRDQQKLDEIHQLYSTAGQRMSSPQYQIQGGGGVGLGDHSPFGEQFGAYANSIRDTIARNWHPGEMRANPVVITFTIRRDGSVVNVKVGTASGNQLMDNSAQRAVMDSQLQALPPGFPRSQADVEMRFELGK